MCMTTQKKRGETGVQGMLALNPPMNMSNWRRGGVDGWLSQVSIKDCKKYRI